nr:T9SS type A sorting domain-containing protein [Chitinophagaceae bacterium]
VNSYSGGFYQPFRANSFSDAKTQFIYTAAELQAAGLGAGNITTIILPIVTKPTSGTGVYSNFTISMKNSSNTNFGSITFETGTTVVYTTNLTTVQGDNTIVLTTPFTWDGTSSLLVDICFDNASSFTNADYIKASITTPVMCVWNRATATTGCSLAAALNNVSGRFIRPDIRLVGAKKINPIESSLITVSQWLGPLATINIYNGSNIMATIKNNTAFDYGCTQVIIDRAGTATTAFWNNVTANRLLDKTFRVIPTNPNPTGSYDITLYYTGTEVANWQTATGNLWAAAKIIKIKEPNQISTITPSSPSSQVANIEVNLPTIPSTFGSNYLITATFNTGFSGFGVGNPGTSTLPISLLSFNGRKNNDVVELSWETAFENNNNRFEIETGKQQSNTLNKIGSVNSKGNSNSVQAYGYTDNLPVMGVNYYRLKQVDFDGNFSYSKTIAVSFDKKGKSLTVYPNPTREKLTIGFAEPQNNVTVRIFAADGKEVKKENAGSVLRTLDVDVTRLIPGSYIIEIRMGKEKHTIQFVKE